MKMNTLSHQKSRTQIRAIKKSAKCLKRHSPDTALKQDVIWTWKAADWSNERTFIILEAKAPRDTSFDSGLESEASMFWYSLSLYASSRIEDGITFILSQFDTYLEGQRSSVCDKILSRDVPLALPTEFLIAILTGTLAAPDLTERARFASQVRDILVARHGPDKTSRLLIGLA